MDFQSYIQWLENVPLYGKKDGIRNMQQLMQAFDHPENKIPVIHVAGTNGKGSVCAMLASVLAQSGYRVGLFTSPHLIHYTERIRVNGCPIAEADWAAIGTEVKEAAEAIAAAGGNHATFFELITAIAFVYFARCEVDVIVLETGVGGRLDATNVVEKPALCVITSISLDHTKVLGDTLPAIASEKAGILQPGAPVVLAQNPPEVQEIVRQRAVELGCPYVYAVQVEGYEVPLVGDYQQQNMAAAVWAVQLLMQRGWHITQETLRSGLAKTQWAGRMEQRLYKGNHVLLDGAHNPAGAQALARYLEKRYAPGSCQLIFSALAKKDVSEILLALKNCAAIGRAIFTCIDGEDQRAYFREIWSREAAEKPYICTENPGEALEIARRQPAEVTVCAGSLYLIGEIEAILEQEREHAEF